MNITLQENQTIEEAVNGLLAEKEIESNRATLRGLDQSEFNQLSEANQALLNAAASEWEMGSPYFLVNFPAENEDAKYYLTVKFFDSNGGTTKRYVRAA